MGIPQKHDELPLGAIRSSFGNGCCVVLVDSALPIVDDSFRKLATKLSAKEQKSRYWILTIPDAAHAMAGKSYTVDVKNVTGAGHDDFDDADAGYAVRVKTSAKVDAAKGLGKIGVADVAADINDKE